MSGHRPDPPKSGSPKDGAWQNELTEEDMPSPAQREDVAHGQRLDPQPAEPSPKPNAPKT
ncbi:MAG: hypothetical protein GIW95_00515 [Candidatus Eremiobacteraeota bacterium]|nr:hypothetical protein [Candidatus Eremiobacteraeota bacterium]